MDVAALIGSLGAVLFAGWSAWRSHVSSDASKQSAEAAETVSQIEQRREHQERRPEVNVWFGKWISEPNMANLNAENRSGKPVDVVVELVGGHSLAGFQDGAPETRTTTHTFDDLQPGIKQTTPFSSVDTKGWDDSTVKFMITIRRGPEEWDGYLDPVKLPRPSPRVRVL